MTDTDYRELARQLEIDGATTITISSSFAQDLRNAIDALLAERGILQGEYDILTLRFESLTKWDAALARENVRLLAELDATRERVAKLETALSFYSLRTAYPLAIEGLRHFAVIRDMGDKARKALEETKS